MALTFLRDQPAKYDPPEPFYVAKARNELVNYAKDHPELPLLLEALEEVSAFASRMRALWSRAESGPVRAVLGGRYGMANALECACGDVSALAWDWKDDMAWSDREERHRYD